jgi:hypothetical protein
VRVYLPTTLGGLRGALDSGVVPVISGVGFAVTDPLRREYPDWSEEDLEYLAMQDAARAALRLIAASRSESPLRVVLSADVPDRDARPRPEADRAVVAVTGTVAWRQVAAVHLDGSDAADAVAQAAAMIDAADLGDDDGEFAVTQAEDFALAWYAPGEVRYLLQELDDPEG